MATRRIQNRPQTQLQAEQKIAFALLVFLGVGGILFGFRSFGSQLYRPIQAQLAKYYTGEDVVNGDQADAKAAEELKKKDSDSDGLSDYDELYVYHTSPYLKDSDSDGIDDKTEVFGGTDPNCPAGKDCSGSGVAATDTASPQGQDTAGTLLQNAGVSPDAVKTGSQDQIPDIQKMLQSATPADIRAALVKAGMSQTEVDKLTDQDILTMYNKALSQAASEGKLNSSAAGAPTAQATTQPKP